MRVLILLQVWYGVDEYEKFAGGRKHYIPVNLEKVRHCFTLYALRTRS